jgi:superfamily II DNA or RNA helicase/restriction endonuclease S subunit
MLGQDAPVADAALAAMPLAFGFDLRPYQERAIRAVETALAEGRREALVAMATGTGKTRLCIALLFRLLTTGRFRRICFVVDRTALGEQAEGEFNTTRVLGPRTFGECFNLAGLDAPGVDQSTRVHITTIQGLVRRVLGGDPARVPSPGQYDLLVVDECHRGYLLDREMSGAELAFRDEADYQSQYRRALEHFDAVRIGLTATPALHTVKIFGRPVFEYGYREAVVDGYLCDHEPSVRIETQLAREGIRYRRGEQVTWLRPDTGELDLTTAPDDLGFELKAFNRKVVTPALNEAVCGELAHHLDPSGPGKALVFCANDKHANLVVDTLSRALEARYGEVEAGAIEKITGSVDGPTGRIRAFRNDANPRIAVTGTRWRSRRTSRRPSPSTCGARWPRWRARGGAGWCRANGGGGGRVMGSLPRGWDEASLADIAADIRNGISAKPADEPPGVPILRISAVRAGRVNLEDTRFHQGSEAETQSYLLREHDLLFVRYNGNPELTAACGMVRALDGACVYPDKLIRVRVDEGKALPQFVEFAMRTEAAREQLRAHIKTASGQHGISGRGLQRVRVPLPPLAEQRRIVARVGALLARTRRARAELGRAASLMQRLREAMIEQAYEPGGDAGWSRATAADLAEIKSGITLGKRYPTNIRLVERPYLRVANVQRGHLDLDEVKTILVSETEAERLALRPGDVLMNEGGDRDKLGRGWIWRGEVPGCIHQNHVFRLRLKTDAVTPVFLPRYANCFGQRYFLDEGKQTTNLASISMSKVAALPVPCLSLPDGEQSCAASAMR